jgi:hypothetical protein
MPSEETDHVSPMKVTPTLGEGALGTWSFHRSPGSRTLCRSTVFRGRWN